MTDVVPQKSRTKSLGKFLLSVMGIAFAGGIFGYFVGGWVREFEEGRVGFFLAEIGFAPSLSSFIGVLLLIIYLISAGLFGLATVNKKIARNRILTGGLGDNPSSRRAFSSLALFYVGYSLAFGVLVFLDAFPKVGLSQPIMFQSLIVIGVCLMGWCAYRVWISFDEFFRAIWVEASALSAFVVLLGVCVEMGAAKLGLIEGISGFDWLVIYQSVYLVVYGIVSGIRDPNMLTMEEPEDA
ncbi:hypothetical protein [Aquidulcibacter sp.]|uniref:hypothetical protein n=1 Tax=Aquidulcibacter sp. TaxID=2052990 RepID=UPI0025C1FFE0|nr:hypothetical protein [Aquidulcibacter sp.]MCA3692425.1 hypothetical protein [Aquidulcibacter sp.]